MVLLTTLGGMSLFGISGFVIGPTIAALFMAAWALFAREEEKTAADGEAAPPEAPPAPAQAGES